ncbi:AAA family ATPase [Halioglobus sp.]|nr:AAA family ATPase [Halioglobus sp.]
MAKGRKKPQRRNPAQSGTSDKPTGNDSVDRQQSGVEAGLRSVENLVEDVGEDQSQLGTLGKLMSKAKSTNAAVDEKTRLKVEEALEEDLQSLVGELKLQLRQAEKAKSDHQTRSNNLQQREHQVSLDRDDIENTKKQLKSDQLVFAASQKEISEKQSLIADQERELEVKLIDAEAGFAQKNEEMLEVFRKEKESAMQTYEDKKVSLRNEIDELNRSVINLKKSIEIESQEIRAELDSEKHELEARKLEIEEERIGLNRLSRKTDLREKMLDRQRESDREEIRSEFLAELERSKNIQDELRKQISTFSKSESEYRTQLADFSKLRAALGGDAPASFIARMERLKSRNEELQIELDLKPSKDVEEASKRLKAENQDLLQARESQDAEIARLSTLVRQNRTSVIDKENLSKENLILGSHNEVLGGRIKELRDEVDDLLSKQESKTAFPALMHMDTSEEHNRTATVEKVSSLKAFATELRQRIAWDNETGKELFFREEDVRLFLAGLSMSKLHILQGISGTGKTSLAKAFARAVGGGSTTVSVQAGWRDKDDLVGHYNSFEKKFYERPCLQALYEAQTPFYSDRPYVILLDEMNLSRPEQYFAEFLSALELDRKDQKLTLMTSAHAGAPKKFIQDQYLKIPENVWFIGTANHDETTFEFADKTYDRAHVLELPRHEERFEIDKTLAPTSYSFSSLEKAFSVAEKKYSEQITNLLDEVTHSDFVETLAQRLGVGWGNRLERQGQRFISTMIASGATIGEALDHLVATKVLRTGKATGRYDTEKDDIEKLSRELKTLWSQLSIKGDPSASEKLLNDELRRKSAH